jgi:hypothetical protein
LTGKLADANQNRKKSCASDTGKAGSCPNDQLPDEL